MDMIEDDFASAVPLRNILSIIFRNVGLAIAGFVLFGTLSILYILNLKDYLGVN